MATFKTCLLLFLIGISQVFQIDAAIRSANFPIGGLFNHDSLDSTKKAFEYISQASTMKPYHSRVMYPSAGDSYSTALEVCQNTTDDKGIVVLLDGRPNNGICDNTCLLCNRLNVSHLSITWQPTETFDKDFYTIAYYPPPDLISKAYATLIKSLQWDKFTILYEDDESFIRLQEIINTWPYNNVPIMYRKLIPGGDNREIFKDIFKVARVSYHVLDCQIENLVHYMNQIVEVENSTQYLSFILTNLDSHLVDLPPNFYANVSTLHLTTANDDRWKDYKLNPAAGARVETALVADALNHLEIVIRSMQESKQEERLDVDYGTPPALCYREQAAQYQSYAWSSGYELRQALLKISAKGFTGDVEFDETGRRTNFQLHHSKLTHDAKFVYAGDWDSKTDIITEEQEVEDRSTSQSSGTIMVVSKKGLPYFDMHEDENGTVTRGYAVDLINMIFDYINEKHKTSFVPKFYKAADNKIGGKIEGPRKWDGMIGELLAHNADLAICDLSISSERNEVVDFSTPFMTTGIATLFKEPDPVEPDMFSFINPLSLDVWLYLVTTYIIVSFVLLICARMSEGDWVNPHPCNQNPENLQNIWSLYNCMWLTMGSIMTQGCDILPRGAGSRWVAGIWYFFALIVTASYTANMSTFLSNSRRVSVITDVKELAEQNRISYGAVKDSSTYNFFKKSNNTVYQQLWSAMSSAKPTVFTASNDEGKERVLRSKGNYAFFMESTAIKYYTERNCQLMMIGSELDSKEYGIAMPKNFPLKGKVDNAILSLQEAGNLSALKTKWWSEEDNPDRCTKIEEDDSGSLQMKNTSGIFLVLAVGAVLGLIVAVIDFLMHARKISIRERIPFKEALRSEWEASLNPRALSKPAAPLRSAAPSPSSSPQRDRSRSRSRAVSVLKAATSFINFDEIY